MSSHSFLFLCSTRLMSLLEQRACPIQIDFSHTSVTAFCWFCAFHRLSRCALVKGVHTPTRSPSHATRGIAQWHVPRHGTQSWEVLWLPADVQSEVAEVSVAAQRIPVENPPKSFDHGLLTRARMCVQWRWRRRPSDYSVQGTSLEHKAKAGSR